MTLALRFVVLLALLCLAMPARAANDLEKKFLAEAPGLIKTLQTRGYRNVGVLKFSVKVGNQAPTDHAGTLNERLSQKLELALILASRPKDPNLVGIIHEASTTAATIKGANHNTDRGRPLLFEKTYPLAWGNQSVSPDAFLTGFAIISPDLRTMDMRINLFDKKSTKLETFADYQGLPVDLEQLLDAGESFTVRGVFDNATLQLTSEERQDKATAEAIKTSLVNKIETEKSPRPQQAKLHPLAQENPDALVSLEVLYDNKPQKIEFRNGGAFLPEPRDNQKVILVVHRKGTGKARLGVVLKVNGESTLYHERSADAQCTPWVFEPESRAFGIRGYSRIDGGRDDFRVLSSAASKSRELDYGADVGMISLSVFPEKTGTPKPTPGGQEDKAAELATLSRNKFPGESKSNLDALQQELAAGFNPNRGLIVPGEKVEEELKTVPFVGDSLPLMSASIRYYSPQDLPK